MIKTGSYELAGGDLIIAPPQIADPRFRRSVLMVTHDHGHGTFAICLNRPTDHPLSQILEPIDIKLDWDQELFWGGPVNAQTVWMLHDTGWRNQYTIPVNDHWSITSHVSMFEQLKSGDLPSRQRISFGFASWAPGQLLAELTGQHPWTHSHSWLILNRPDPDWLISVDPDDMWAQAMQQCGTQAVEHWL